MKVLFIKQLFYPEPTAKSLDFALELKKRGHEVQVLTGFPSYPHGKIYKGYKQKIWQKEFIQGIEVIRVPIYPNQSNSGFKRMLHYLSYAVSATLIGLFLVKKPDVAFVYQGAIPVAIPAIVLKTIRGVPFLYDINDLWPDTVEVSGMMENKKLFKLINSWCNFNYNQASHISVATSGFKKKLTERGIKDEKITVVPNWSRDKLTTAKLPENKREKIFPEGKLQILYAGNLGVVQSLHTVLDAAKHFESEGNNEIQFTFLGAGAEEKNLKEYSDLNKLSNVQFLPRVSSEEVGLYLNSADVLLVHLKDVDLFKITIPSKILSYLRTGKPILLGLRGDSEEIIKSSNAGLLFEPENKEDLIHQIMVLRNLGLKDRAKMGRNGKNYYEKYLSLESSTSKLISCFTRIANS